MSEHDYLLAWSVYLGAATLGYLAGWQLTGWLWRWIREPIRLAAAILLFTPTLIDPEQGRMAPAVAIVALDMLFEAGSSLWRAVLDLSSVATFAVPGWLLFCLGRWLWRRSRRPARVVEAPAVDADEEATFAEILQSLPEQQGGRREPTL